MQAEVVVEAILVAQVQQVVQVAVELVFLELVELLLLEQPTLAVEVAVVDNLVTVVLVDLEL
jgi:hypothetical protein